MLDATNGIQYSLDYWDRQPTDQPWLLNGFKGTWNFRDHSLIPGELNNFIMEAFHPAERLKRIPLEDINKLMNEVWEGPGSMSKIVRLTGELRSARLSGLVSNMKMEEVKTIDDFTEDDFNFKPVDEKELADDEGEE